MPWYDANCCSNFRMSGPSTPRPSFNAFSAASTDPGTCRTPYRGIARIDLRPRLWRLRIQKHCFVLQLQIQGELVELAQQPSSGSAHSDEIPEPRRPYVE